MKFEPSARGERRLIEFWRGFVRAYGTARTVLARQIAEDMCLYEGIHWITSNEIQVTGPFSELKALVTSQDPDKRIRVTANRVHWLVQKAMAATHPSNLSVNVFPPDADWSTEASYRAQVLEDAANCFIDKVNYLGTRQDANFHRSCCGHWGVGLNVRMGEGGVASDVVETFDFDATHLTLDPHVKCRDLERHDVVGFTDVWTYEKLAQIYPEYARGIEKEQLKTCGQLAPMHLKLSELTGGRVFSQFDAHSNSKGVLIHQVHCKNPDTGRFEYMYVLIDDADPTNTEGMRWANMDNAMSPFGGDGLPLALYHAHNRPGSLWSIGDARMVRDEQHSLNFIRTMLFRILRKHGGPTWVIDRNSMGQGRNAEDWKRKFHNGPGAIIDYESSRDRQRPVQPPQLISYPSPPAFLTEMSRQAEETMKDLVHRAEGNFGQTKSHVPDSSFQRAIEEADQVLGIRIERDIKTDERMARLLLGTGLRMAQSRSPFVLADLKETGFGPDEFTVVAMTDPTRLSGTVKLRQSVRHRSENAKKQDLDMALQAGAMSPREYRRELASTLDRPLFEEDRYYVTEARKWARRIRDGMEWQPIALAEQNEVFIAEFRRALISSKVMMDPGARDRLTRAIEGQMQMMMAEAQMAAGATAGAGAAQEQAPQEQLDGTAAASVGDVLGMLESGGQARPVAALPV